MVGAPEDELVTVVCACGWESRRTWSCDDSISTTLGLRRALDIRYERTSQNDVGFGLRQLTDVAVKALSPGINDPTTAVHALSHSAALLCELSRRDLGAQASCDDDGRVRVVVRQRSFPELLDLAVAQPRFYGAGDPCVMRSLLELLGAVAWLAVGSEQAAAVDAQLARTRKVVAQGSLDEVHRGELDELAGAVDAVLRRESRATW